MKNIKFSFQSRTKGDNFASFATVGNDKIIVYTDNNDEVIGIDDSWWWKPQEDEVLDHPIWPTWAELEVWAQAYISSSYDEVRSYLAANPGMSCSEARMEALNCFSTHTWGASRILPELWQKLDNALFSQCMLHPSADQRSYKLVYHRCYDQHLMDDPYRVYLSEEYSEDSMGEVLLEGTWRECENRQERLLEERMMAEHEQEEEVITHETATLPKRR